MRRSAFLRGPLGALLLIVAALGLAWPAERVQPLNVFDQPFYLGIAYDLRHLGRFTDGYMFADPGPDGTRPPGMRFAPLYPAFLAATASLDPSLRRGMECEVLTNGKDATCPRAAPLPRALQFAMLVGVYLLVWWLGAALSDRRRVAWLALLIALPTAPLLLHSVNYLMTEILSLLLSTAATAAAVHAFRPGRRVAWLGLAGVLLGMAALTRPAFLYVFYGTLLVGLAAIALSHHRLVSARRLAVYALATVVVVLPWVGRNAVELGRPALTFGYDSHTLVQRISFDSMTWREYGLAYLCWLPDGNGLGSLLVAPHACDRFGWDERPDTFYAIGMGPLMQRTLAEAGGWSHHLRFLLTHYILREPLWHLAVTIPLALRGAWIDKYWGLVLGPISAWLSLGALRRRETGLLIVALPAWFLLLFNAAVAVNQVRYNYALIPVYALSGAVLGDTLLRRYRSNVSDRAKPAPR